MPRPSYSVPLFVPGSRRDRFAKAAQSGADAVILDLEDAVAEADKEQARSVILDGVGEAGPTVIIRINRSGTPWHEGDCGLIRRLPDAAVMLPKAEAPEDISRLCAAVGRAVPVIPLIETAKGLDALPAIARAPAVVQLAIGTVDLALDLGCRHDRQSLLLARSEMVWRSRSAELPAPLDGVTTALDDPSIVENDAAHAAALGFGGKMAIHPRQTAAIRKAFHPSDEEVDWARRVLHQASSGEAVRVNGEMIDRPVIERARAILARAEGTPQGG